MKDKVTAILLAAGKGSRMKSNIQKQFMMLGEYPVIYYSLRTLEESPVDDIILVTGYDDIEYCRTNIVEKYGFFKVKKIVAGGNERYESVRNALNAADESEYILIHDGARPFITSRMICDSIRNVKIYGACTVGMPVKDTIKRVDRELMGIETPDRKFLYQIQTPQIFEREILVNSYRKLTEANDNSVTDDTMVVERYSGKKTKVLEGSYMNLKITTPEDLQIAEIFLKNVLT
ncbi:MAG: 2-C-methyl-D-erythritol 4-phosphate cytidylyltransferase [Coprococcus sp.]